jgi:hypothetical protein
LSHEFVPLLLKLGPEGGIFQPLIERVPTHLARLAGLRVRWARQQDGEGLCLPGRQLGFAVNCAGFRALFRRISRNRRL